MNPTPLFRALCMAGVTYAGWAIQRTHYSPGAYVRAAGPFGAFRLLPTPR